MSDPLWTEGDAEGLVEGQSHGEGESLALAELSVVSRQHQLPSDRARREIKNRTVFRGQFSIGMTLLGVVAISVLLGLPSLFEWEQAAYWGGVLLALFCLTPILGFFAIAISDHMGFPIVVRYLLGVGVWLTAPAPFLTILVARDLQHGTILSGAFCDSLVYLLFWIPQVIALVAAKILMKY